jgi:hypothetical protein
MCGSPVVFTGVGCEQSISDTIPELLKALLNGLLKTRFITDLVK